jgi:multidrug efflux pump
MGLVIFTGISIGTLFTLFVVPAMYMFLGAEHRQASAKEMAITGGYATEGDQIRS